MACRLTLGLMGLDELHLRVLATSSEDLSEKKNAKKGKLCSLKTFSTSEIPTNLEISFRSVLGLMQKGRHWVLVVRPSSVTSFYPRIPIN